MIQHRNEQVPHPPQPTRFAWALLSILAISLALAHGQQQPFTPISQEQQGVCPSVFGGDWVVFSLGGIAIGIIAYALLYMIGSILNRPQVKGLVRSGLADIAGLFIFLMVVIALGNVMCSATFSTIGVDSKTFASYNFLASKGIDPGNIPLLSLGEAYLNLLYYLGEKLYKSLIIQLVYASAITSVKVSAGSMVGEIQPLSGLEPLLNMGNMFFASLALALMSVSAQMYLLKFFALTGMPLFFPLGVLMRALPPTRSFGAALIGLAVAMSFFYPLILAYNFIILVTAINPDDAMLNSLLYNSPMCNGPQDCLDTCNSGAYITDTSDGGTRYFCAPCILVGTPPGNDGSLCCQKTSKFKNGVCEMDDSIPPEKLGSGGIIAKGAKPEGYGLTYFIGASVIFTVGAKILDNIPIVSKLANAVSATLIVLMQIGLVVAYKLGLGIIMNPVAVMAIILVFNSNFFFLGFILPMIEFVIMVEFVRTLTGSLGEPIDIIQLLKVI
ncbi:MAG: hypothetical protein N3G76_01825 [Candidatus Micrarchaeota archaeon]|nr:hypothetical protein [Candidatus Micrarchaeota archaeon]